MYRRQRTARAERGSAQCHPEPRRGRRAGEHDRRPSRHGQHDKPSVARDSLAGLRHKSHSSTSGNQSCTFVRGCDGEHIDPVVGVQKLGNRGIREAHRNGHRLLALRLPTTARTQGSRGRRRFGRRGGGIFRPHRRERRSGSGDGEDGGGEPASRTQESRHPAPAGTCPYGCEFGHFVPMAHGRSTGTGRTVTGLSGHRTHRLASGGCRSSPGCVGPAAHSAPVRRILLTPVRDPAVVENPVTCRVSLLTCRVRAARCPGRSRRESGHSRRRAPRAVCRRRRRALPAAVPGFRRRPA